MLQMEGLLSDGWERWKEEDVCKGSQCGKPGESSESDEEGNEGRWEWLTRFSTMKVGPLKHARPATKTKCLGLRVRVTTHRMMSRQAGLEAKKRLKRLCEFPLGAFDHQPDETEVPANVADYYHVAKDPFGVKQQANDIVSEPMSKCMWVKSQKEAEMMAWMEQKMTKASDELKIVSLKESIIWKAWVRWEEGLRLAHRQQEIGEAAARMETMYHQPILVLKLTEGEHAWFEMWRRQYLG